MIIAKGQEPERIKKRIDVLFEKLNEAYPDKVISGLDNEHKRWAETALDISRALGYPSKKEFLEAYGYSVVRKESSVPAGRPSSVDPAAIIKTLQERYPNGSDFRKADELFAANPDVLPFKKSLMNKASSVFGMPLGKYLKQIGLLSSVREPKLDDKIRSLQERYQDRPLPDTLAQLKNENEDLKISGLDGLIRRETNEEPIPYLYRQGLLSEECYKKFTENEDPKTVVDLFVADLLKDVPEGAEKQYSALEWSRINSLSKRAYHKSLDDLLKAQGIVILDTTDPNGTDSGVFDLEGKRVVTTYLYPDQENRVAHLTKQGGGQFIASSVSEKTAYLVVSDGISPRSSKLAKAEALIRDGKPIQIITYSEFIKSAEEAIKRYRERLAEGSGSDTKNTQSEKATQYITVKKEKAIQFTIERKVLTSFKGTVEEIIIPDEVKFIGMGAFASSGIKRIVIPEGVTEIRRDAFRDCKQLREVVLPDSLTTIGDHAFFNCTKLETIHIPNGVSVLKRSVFEASKINELVLSPNTKEIKKDAFTCSIKKLYFDGDDPEIDRYAFDYHSYKHCSHIQELVVSDSIKTIPSYTFDKCGEIKSITFLSKETTIHGSSFSESAYPALAKAVLPSQLNTNLSRELAPYAAKFIDGGVAPSDEYTEQWTKAIGKLKNSLENTVTEYPALFSLMLQEGFLSVKYVHKVMENTQDNELKMQLMEYVDRFGSQEDDLDPDATLTVSEVRKSFKLFITSDDTAMITGYKGNDKEVIIPDKAGKYNVTEIGEEAFKGQRFERITIPEGITKIGSKAFLNCKNLKSVNLPDSITAIGDQAFDHCTSLTSISIPLGVRTIKYGTFMWCSSMKKVDIHEKVTVIEKSAFENCRSLRGITIPEHTTIKQNAFKGCDGLVDSKGLIIIRGIVYGYCGRDTEIDIPYGVKSIEERAFSENIYLKKVTIPDSVADIGNYAFSGCASIRSITIPDSITNINWGTFSSCVSLRDITIPDSVVNISDGPITDAFKGCYFVTVHAPTGSCAERYAKSHNNTIFEASDSIIQKTDETEQESNEGSASENALMNTRQSETDVSEAVDQNGFVIANGVLKRYKGKDKEISIPDGVTQIGDSAFFCCTSVTKVTIPDGVTTIGLCAFIGCENLISVIISDSVKCIKGGAFTRCTNLKNINIPDGITDLDGLFEECTSLTSIRIPDSVTCICVEAFSGCSNLTDINIPEGVTLIGSKAFNGCTNLKDITIPDSVTIIGSDAFNNTAWYNHQPDGSVYAGKVFYKYKGVMSRQASVVINEGTKAIADSAFSDCKSLKSIVIPDSVTNIGFCAFRGCKGLTDITIPNSVTSIDDRAFSFCEKLTNVTIPESVTVLESGVFARCTSLESVTIPEGVTKIHYDMFYGCKSLKSIDLPDSLTSIGNNAFQYCSSLTSIIIPDKTTRIGRTAFCSCSSLTSIFIPDSVTEIGENAFSLCPNLTIHAPAGSYAEQYAKDNSLSFEVL